MNPGTLYLIPASLGDPKAGGDAALVGSTLPPATRAIARWDVILPRIEEFFAATAL